MRRQTTKAAVKHRAPSLRASSLRASSLRRLMLGLLESAALAAFCLPASAQESGGKFLDAKYCTDALNLIWIGL